MSKQIGEVILDLQNISLRFGGVKALTDISFDVREHEIRAIIGPNGRARVHAQRHQRGLSPQEGVIIFHGRERKKMEPHHAATQGIARTFQNIALFKGMSVLDNIMTGRITRMKANFIEHAPWLGRAKREELEHRKKSGGSHRLPRNPAYPQNSGGSPALRLAKASGTGSGAGGRAVHAAAGRADGRHERRGETGHVPLHLDVNDQFGTTIVLIEHDMGVVMDISDRVVVLDYGKKIGDGLPDDVKTTKTSSPPIWA